MDGMQQITLDQWMSWKEDIREKLKETAGNFVYIGFRLKQIRDSGILGGAADIFEFAQNEYGLSKSTTSRFIAINEKFSEGGNSIELRKEYKAIGSSKLAEMLTLTDAECQLITERTTVKEIRDLKNFSRQQVSEEEEADEKQLSHLQKCLVDYFKDKKDMLNAVVKAIYENAEKEAVELMNPSGYATHKKGVCFMFMFDYNSGVKAKLLTEPEPVTMTWKDVLAEVYDIFGNLYEDGEDDIHKAYYGQLEKEVEKTQENEPEKMEESQKRQGNESSVATSQREEDAEKIIDESEDEEESEKYEKEGEKYEKEGEKYEKEGEKYEEEVIEQNGNAEFERDEAGGELYGTKCEVGTTNELSDGEAATGTVADEAEDQFERSDDEIGRDGCSDICSDVCDTNKQIAEQIESDVKENASRIFEKIKKGGGASHWRQIKHGLYVLSADIEKLIEYIERDEVDEGAEEEDQEEDE